MPVHPCRYRSLILMGSINVCLMSFRLLNAVPNAIHPFRALKAAKTLARNVARA
jgi:hypothetical protein